MIINRLKFCFRLRFPRLTRRRIALIALGGMLLGVAVIFGPRLYALWIARGRIYTVESAPDDAERRVAVVFGAEVLPSGRLSAMLADRVAAGAALYHAGKVDVLLMTGDNRFDHYNEPEAMRQYAVRLGVPDEAIVLDYAGRRTYDSCVRARKIFGVESAILVTQRFHLPRALLLCDTLGLDVIGVAADEQRPRGYSPFVLRRLQLREFPATGLAVLDLLRRPTPVLGEPLPIFADSDEETAPDL